MRAGAGYFKKRPRSVRQMIGQDGLQQPASRCSAHLSDLCIDAVGGDACLRHRLHYGCMRIQYTASRDFVAMSEGYPAQRGRAGGEREVRLLLGIVAGGAGQRARIGRAARGQLDRHIEQARILGGSKPLTFGAGRAGKQVAQDLVRRLVGILPGDCAKGGQVRRALIGLHGIAPVSLVKQAR